jgi:enoyl-[acyl-carrier protein] reductase I
MSLLNLEGRVAVVFGIANKRSIAYAIAQKLHEAGCKLAICYQNERLKSEVEGIVGTLPGSELFQCDVSRDADIDQVFAAIKEKFPTVHVLVHSLAFAPADELKHDFLLTSREGFRVAHDISAYSLIALSRGVAPLMTDGGSIITLTYYGAEKVIPNYNVMGVAKAALESTVRYLAASLGQHKIRVNAISAGPIKTLAARGIGDLGTMLRAHSERSPLRRNVEQAEVGGAAMYLASDLASGTTGEVLFVDCGYNVIGL